MAWKETTEGILWTKSLCGGGDKEWILVFEAPVWFFSS